MSTFVMTDEARAAVADLAPGTVVHVVVIGTKPDIIKQMPVYRELVARGLPTLLCHSMQHQDHANSGGMLAEFGLTVDIWLRMPEGLALHARVAALVESAGDVLAELKSARLAPLPYVHGDTATSMGVTVAAFLNAIACVHVEAGIRTLTPTREFLSSVLETHRAGSFDFEAYVAAHLDPQTFESGSFEPFPEQFNTRVSDAGSGFHAAPVELVRSFLLGEGFPAETIAVVGNTVVDATLEAKANAATSRIFDRFPRLASGEFIRMCVHRRENTADEARFRALYSAMEQLLERGRSILLIQLNGTKDAFRRWGLEESLRALEARYPDTLIVSDVWPEYGDVIAAMLRCSVIATDSGSMQEEMNVLGIPCVTLRFGSDRGESFLAGGNVLAPPVSGAFVADVIDAAYHARDRLRPTAIYGTDCAKALVDEVLARAVPHSGLFRSEEQRLRLAPAGPEA